MKDCRVETESRVRKQSFIFPMIPEYLIRINVIVRMSPRPLAASFTPSSVRGLE
jgi:hypothetical protein